jgi:phytoene dehydrogenase-like protein
MSEGLIALPAAGMAAVPAQLAERAREAGATVRLDDPVASVSGDDDGATVEAESRTLDVDAAVVATDPRTARRLTGVSAIPTDARPSVTAYVSLPEGPALDDARKIHLNAADDRPNAVVALSAVAPTYAPSDRRLLCATFLGEDALDADEATLVEATRDALASWYPERRFDGLEGVHTERIEFAQFAQPPGVHDDLPDHRAPNGAVYLAGDYTAWSSIQGAMRSGREAATALLADRDGASVAGEG